jgi:hypothetical protein
MKENKRKKDMNAYLSQASHDIINFWSCGQMRSWVGVAAARSLVEIQNPKPIQLS